MDTIQLGITDSSIRFRAKTVGVVEKAMGVDKELTSATSAPGRKDACRAAFARQTVRADPIPLGGQVV
jgi:hypothetical protein